MFSTKLLVLLCLAPSRRTKTFRISTKTRLNLVCSLRNDLGKRVGINFPWGQTGRRRARAPLSHGGGGAGVGGERGAGCVPTEHIVSIYHSHVTKFSPHRETLLTSTEHVALPILYIIAARVPAQHVTTWRQLTFTLGFNKK